MLERSSLLLVLALAASACGGDDGPAVDGDGGPNDGVVIRPLVGTWRALPSNFDAVPRPEEFRNRLVYGADNTLTTTYDGFTRMWDYTVDADLVSATARDADEPRAKGYRYHITGTTMLDVAMAPMNPGAGLVNTWTTRGTLNGGRLDMTWALRANLSTTVTLTGDAGTVTMDGTWEGRDNDVYLQVLDADRNPVGYLGKMLDDRLGIPYELLP